MKIGKLISYFFYNIITHSLFDYFFILIVIGNSIVLSLYGDVITDPSPLEIANDVFTYIFLAEFLMKFIGLGVIEYFSDITNYIDLTVVICGLLDIEFRTIYSTSSNSKQFSNISLIKGIKIIRAIRIVRLLRNMKTMRNIMHGIYESSIKILYVFILLVVFILIYMIFGMSVLKGSVTLSEHLNAFYLVFQILTIENWNSSLYELT